MKRLLIVAALCACSRNDEPPPEVTSPRNPLKASTDRIAEQVLTEPVPPEVEEAVRRRIDSAVQQRLYAPDVAAGTLPLSIRIETIGGVASEIIPRGTKLPTSHTEVFSTGLDDQTRVEVHVLQGERPLVAQNRSLGKFQLFGIPPAPRGVPQIEVTFAIDEAGVLSVGARDKATDRVQAIQIDSVAAQMLDKAAVNKILAEARAAKTDDDALIELATTRNELETLIYADKNLIKDVGSKLSAKTRARFEREIKSADAVLKTATRPADLKLLLASKESLSKAGHDAATELYANAK